jgi:hypothetical protein
MLLQAVSEKVLRSHGSITCYSYLLPRKFANSVKVLSHDSVWGRGLHLKFLVLNNSPLNGREWKASRCGRFISSKRVTGYETVLVSECVSALCWSVLAMNWPLGTPLSFISMAELKEANKHKLTIPDT